MEEVHGNYSSCCRLCLLGNTDVLKAIFDDDNGTSTIVNQIHTSLGIKVSTDDKLSTRICQKCITKVEDWNTFKKTCSENQEKLENWLNDDENKEKTLSSTHDEETPSTSNENLEGDENHDPDEQVNKVETPSDLDIPMDHDGDEVSNVLKNQESAPKRQRGARKCMYCNKLFSTSGNCRKHEKKVHEKRFSHLYFKDLKETELEGVQEELSFVENGNDETDNKVIKKEKEMKSDSPIMPILEKEKENKERPEADKEKLEFAGALKLKAANGNITAPINYTKVELCYIDKMKKMVLMLNTFLCICHNMQHKTMKRLFAHLRPLCKWFPVYTCYNCMISFSDRSSSMKHNTKCHRRHLENLLKLSVVKEFSEMKIRLYHSYRCATCRYTFNFHDDYCNHIDVVHMQEDFPYKCDCDVRIEVTDEYKKHMYYGCCLVHYCDICFEEFKTLNDFKKHVEETHDNEEDFEFLPVKEQITTRVINNSYETSLNSLNAELNAAAASAFIEDDNDEAVECAPDLEMDSSYDTNKSNQSIKMSRSDKNWNQKASCTICGKVYSNYHNMLRHYKTHDDSENTIPCDHCDEMFRLKSQLKEHLIVAHGFSDGSPYKQYKMNLIENSKVSYPCPECNLVFSTVDEWVQHKRLHSSNICRDCGKEFFTQSEYAKHNCEGTNKIQNGNLQCQICSMTFASMGDMRQHMLVHVKEEPVDEVSEPKRKKYSCEPCNKHYVGYGGLWEHNKRYHPERRYKRDYPRKCKQCDKVLMTGGAYYMHKQMHERWNSGGESSKSVEKMDDEDYSTCNKCFKVFPNKVSLRKHMKCHGIIVGRTMGAKGGKFKTYWCNICHQACNGFMELQSHKQEHELEKMNDIQEGNMANNSPVYPDVQMEEGDPDDVMYADNGQPELDILAITDDVMYTCDICDLEFLTEPELEKHKEYHEAENAKHAFVYCKHCKIPFKNLEKLNEHMEFEHDEAPVRQKQKSGESAQEKYPCNMCKKVFDTNGALSSHQGWHKRVKAGEKGKMIMKQVLKDFPSTSQKYTCKTCYQNFINDTALQIHILEVHRNINTSLIMPRCDMCALDFDSQAALDKHNQFHKLVEKQKEGKKLQYLCKFCNKAFYNIESLNTHVEQYHRVTASNHICHICKRSFDRPQALATHVKTHKQPPPKPAVKPSQKFLYSCSICHKGFNIPKELRNHIIQSHPF